MTQLAIFTMPTSSKLAKRAHLQPLFHPSDNQVSVAVACAIMLMLPASQAQSQSIEPPEFEGSLELTLQQAEAQDADGVDERDTGQADLSVTLGLEQALGERARLVGRLELSTTRYTRETRNNDDESAAYDLERLFLEVNPSDDLRLRLGRQAIDDSLEAVVDEDLDGIRLSFESGDFELDFSQTREDWFEASTFERQDNINNTYGTLRFSPNKNTSWTPYILRRVGDSFNEAPEFEATWIGLQGIVEPSGSGWRYWLHGSAMDGSEKDDTDTIQLGGTAFQLGVNWTWDGPWEPTFTVAASQASGGDRDDRFRQSGLQGNDFALNDKTSFRYLGEVLDPELTNIRIITLGVGAEITKKWTTDIALHSYQQVEIEDNLRGSDIEYDPSGESDDLGIGADLVVAYEPNKQLEFIMTTGRFIPGDAFDATRDDAWITRVEIDYSF